MPLEILPLVLALVVVLLITLMAFMKLKSTEARNDEIRKLLLVAAEEARRVEAEHRDYGVAFDRLSLNQCAVCFSTTTSRCSRCKTVKYCSGKCQIIHWRQGHKQQCQPPDTVSSSGLVSYISSDCSEADSTISSEMQETRPFIPDLKEPKTCGSIYQRLNLYNSKIPEIYALETTDMLVMGPEITKEVSGPDISDGIESTQNNALRSHMELEVPNSSIHLSSEISIHNVPTKTTHINDIPDYESTLSYVPTTFTVPLPDNVNYCTHSPIGVHSVCTESPGIHVPSKSLINVIPCSLGTTRNICNSLKNDFPASSSFSSNFTEPITSEHELDYSSSFLPDISSTISQMSDFPKSISPKKSLNSKILVTDFSPAENLLEQSKSTKSHIPYASSPKTSMLDSLSDISCLDLPSSTSFASNVSSSGISGTSSPCLKYSNSLNSSSTIKFKSHEPNEPNATILASEIQGPRISLSNSTGKRTSGTDSLHCSPHRERVSVYPILGKRAIIIGESSVAVQVEACHPVVNGCSRSCDSTISSSGIAGPSSPCLDLVPFKLSSTSSLIISDACCSSSLSTIKFQNHEPNEHNATILAAEIQGPRVSLSDSTRKRTSGTDLTHSSPHRERVSIFSISGEHASSIEGESSVTMQLEGSHPTINGLKRSEQKSTKHPKFSKGSTGKSSGRINESLVKSSELFFPYEYFPKLFNWDNLEFPPRGLINCGNSCYANVVLQCLTYTRPLAAYLLHGFHSEECQRKDWCFMCELEHLVSKVRRGESALSPIRILSGIQKIGNHLGYGKQEDAHEFLRLAIDTMQSIFLDKAGGEKTVNRTAHSTTFIQQLFGGYLQSKVKCKKCQYESNRYELIMDLTVEVHGSIESLEDALDQFTRPELLDGENEYKCNRCKSYVKAQKRLTVHEAPNVLTIVLKRFRTGKFGKLNKIVAFPEVLDMSPYMSGIGDKPPSYKLYAVVVHLDVLNASFFGHYICYVKDLKGAWYKIDDSKVIPVGLDVVMSEGAYMLLYSRSSPRPLAVLHDEMAESCKEVPLNHCTYDVEQSSSSDGYNKETEAHTKHFPSLDICRDANVHVDQPVRLSDLDYHAMDLDSSVADSSNGCGFGCERISQITRDMKIDRVPREYGDSTSSDAGSLFSGSDETSCSTDSNRDSTSTVDLAETVFADSRYLECSNLNVAEACGISSSLSCMGSSPRLSETYSALENYGSFPYHSFPNQPIGNTRIDQGFTLSNPDAFDTDSSHSLPADSPNSFFQKPWAHSVVSESSLKHRDMLNCSVSGRNAYLLQSSQFKISESLDHPKDNSCECFAVPAKRKHLEEKHKSDETEKSKLHAPSRTYAVTNFKHFLAHDSRTSAITKARSLGFER